MAKLTGDFTGRVYYTKRVGWRWQVWFAYQDGSPDPADGATEWLASPVKFWRWINAEHLAIAIWTAFNDGVWVESGRTALTKDRTP